jgi:hypothetical protein
LVDGHFGTIGIHHDRIEQGGAGAAGPQSAEFRFQDSEGTSHPLFDFFQIEALVRHRVKSLCLAILTT